MKSIYKIKDLQDNEERINFGFKGRSYWKELQTISTRIATIERNRPGI